MFEVGNKSSIIRELYMYGRKKAAEIGADKVYDFRQKFEF
jgi:aspartate aminotransferase